MIVSDKIQSLGELCEKYHEFPFALDGIKHRKLTLEDFCLINRILIGCTKLSYYHEQGCRDLYSSRGKSENRKHYAGLLAFNYILNSSKSNSVFRPKDIRVSFPEDIQNISAADLSRIVRTFKKIHLIKKDTPPKKKGGRPALGEDNIPGAKSYYSKSDYLFLLKNLITKPLVRAILFSILLESKVIQRYIEYSCLFVLYEIKFLGLANALKTLKNSVGLNKEQVLRYMKNLSGYEKIAKNPNLKLVKSLAHKMAVDQLKHRNFKDDSFYNYYYAMGGIFYYS